MTPEEQGNDPTAAAHGSHACAGLAYKLAHHRAITLRGQSLDFRGFKKQR